MRCIFFPLNFLLSNLSQFHKTPWHRKIFRDSQQFSWSPIILYLTTILPLNFIAIVSFYHFLLDFFFHWNLPPLSHDEFQFYRQYDHPIKLFLSHSISWDGFLLILHNEHTVLKIILETLKEKEKEIVSLTDLFYLLTKTKVNLSLNFNFNLLNCFWASAFENIFWQDLKKKSMFE